ncbi:hypothetical protein [Haloarcula sediminis]|uniref:hypothetical protein n=1 Tax=Haloarcula sediminis TaxID=3111777 RepID=UPI002D789D80|nr:hypothetical protein [Haloarcula sp. CK38]
MPSPDDESDSAPALSEAELYRIVHEATQDAILGAVGTILLAGVGVVLFLAGLSAIVGALNIVGTVLGVCFAALGLYLVASLLDGVPSLWG